IEVDLARIQSDAEHLAKSCMTELGQPLTEVVSSLDPAILDASRSEPTSRESTMEGVQTDTPSADSEPQPTAHTPEARYPSSPADEGPSFDLESARERLAELRTKIDEMGSVNMMALEELEESEQRFKFLSGQRDDILKSIKGTEDALSEIKRRSREK